MSYRWIKVQAVESGKSLKDVAAALGMPYDRFSHVVNGFRKAPGEDFSERVTEVFKGWKPDSITPTEARDGALRK